jgi:DNA-binding CsgD family transcriptional regulator
MVRVEFPLPLGRAFECFVFSHSEFSERGHAAEVAYALLSSWPTLKPILLSERTSITSRERESLIAAAEGLTAREAAVRMSCTERTVNHHWSRAMIKMRATNKIAAVQRAVWLGLI